MTESIAASTDRERLNTIIAHSHDAIAVAVFAVPQDLTTDARPMVWAVDGAGNVYRINPAPGNLRTNL